MMEQQMMDFGKEDTSNALHQLDQLRSKWISMEEENTLLKKSLKSFTKENESLKSSLNEAKKHTHRLESELALLTQRVSTVEKERDNFIVSIQELYGEFMSRAGYTKLVKAEERETVVMIDQDTISAVPSDDNATENTSVDPLCDANTDENQSCGQEIRATETSPTIYEDSSTLIRQTKSNSLRSLNSVDENVHRSDEDTQNIDAKFQYHQTDDITRAESPKRNGTPATPDDLLTSSDHETPESLLHPLNSANQNLDVETALIPEHQISSIHHEIIIQPECPKKDHTAYEGPRESSLEPITKKQKSGSLHDTSKIDATTVNNAESLELTIESSNQHGTSKREENHAPLYPQDNTSCDGIKTESEEGKTDVKITSMRSKTNQLKVVLPQISMENSSWKLASRKDTSMPKSDYDESTHYGLRKRKLSEGKFKRKNYIAKPEGSKKSRTSSNKFKQPLSISSINSQDAATEKLWCCNTCKSYYTSSIELEKHTKESHAGVEVKFTCQSCGYIAISMETMKFHEETLHKNVLLPKPSNSKIYWECEICKKERHVHTKLASREELDKHIFENHPNPLPEYLRCIEGDGNCVKYFKTAGRLRFHINSCHRASLLNSVVQRLSQNGKK